MRGVDENGIVNEEIHLLALNDAEVAIFKKFAIVSEAGLLDIDPDEIPDYPDEPTTEEYKLLKGILKRIKTL